MIVRVGEILFRKIEAFQGRHSLVSVAPFIDKNDFECIATLEKGWRKIRAELDAILKAPEDIPSFHQLSPDQSRISKGDNWKMFPLYIFRHRIDENCRLCPDTAKILDDLPGLNNAMFSILAPGYHIPPHKGPSRAVIRGHLALKVPEARERCWLRVDNQTAYWTEGQCLLFDDTYEHEVYNDTDEMRVLLMFDLDRPMDRLGTMVNTLSVGLICTSTYAKEPLKNLKAWNLKRDQRDLS